MSAVHTFDMCAYGAKVTNELQTSSENPVTQPVVSYSHACGARTVAAF